MSDKAGDNDRINSLWVEYNKNRAIEIRNQLIEHYLPLVNIIAGRLAINLPGHVDRDDLLISGYFGLMDAIEKFEYARGIKFETYAGVRINGAMKDELRAKDWISVSLRQRIKSYENAVISLQGKLGRGPTEEELATELGLNMDQLHSLEQQLNVATLVPLGEYMQGEGKQAIDTDPYRNTQYVEIKETLAQAIDQLSEKERMVVSLYYYEELTMKEISLIMNLSEARICQLHTKAMLNLRGALGEDKISF